MGAPGLILAIALAQAQSSPRVLRLSAETPYIEAIIGKVPVRLRVDLAAHERILLDRGVAERLKLTTAKSTVLALIGLREMGAIDLRIGPVALAGRWAAETLRIGATSRDVQVAWFDHETDDGADGVISPALLPYDEVVLVRRPSRPSDRDLALPVRLDGWHGLVSRWAVGKAGIDVALSLAAPTTLATAAAGQILSQAGEGVRTGPTWREPIALGVARPVRTVRLARPLTIAGFSVGTFAMRVSDWAGDGAPPPDADLPPDEVAVEARGKRQRAWARLILGLDRLAACAELAYRRKPQQIRLTCSFDAAPAHHRVGVGSGPE